MDLTFGEKLPFDEDLTKQAVGPHHIYVFLLLLRSLRACSFGVVLVKVAKIHRYDADRSPVSVFWDDERAGAIFVLQQLLI